MEDKETPKQEDKRIALYEVGGKYFMKQEGGDETQISYGEYMRLRELKDSDTQRLSKK